MRGHPAFTDRNDRSMQPQYVALCMTYGGDDVHTEYGEVIALLRCRNTLVPNADNGPRGHELLFVRFLNRATYTRVANGSHPAGEIVPGKGFAVRRARDTTPVTMTPVVWEEMEKAATARPRQGVPAGPQYGLVEVSAVEGEVFLLPNHTMPPGHFLVFDLNQPPSDAMLRNGPMPDSWN